MQVIRLNRLNYMKNDFAYDPVTALSEVDAKGEIAVIFNDIKCTMQFLFNLYMERVSLDRKWCFRYLAKH